MYQTSFQVNNLQCMSSCFLGHGVYIYINPQVTLCYCNKCSGLYFISYKLIWRCSMSLINLISFVNFFITLSCCFFNALPFMVSIKDSHIRLQQILIRLVLFAQLWYCMILMNELTNNLFIRPDQTSKTYTDIFNLYVRFSNSCHNCSYNNCIVGYLF